VENVEAVTVGLYVRLEARTGCEEEVERFDILASKLPVAAMQRQ
jgi:hypothetical protein